MEYENQFVKCIIDTWDKLVFVSDHLSGEWAFRGQADANWGLGSGLERILFPNHYNTEEDKILFIENEIIEHFLRQSRLYDISFDELTPDIECLSLIQHHGGPTRLLDISSTFYIALFFALENAYDNSAVWAFNHYYMNQLVKKILPDKYKGYHYDKTARLLAKDILNGKDFGFGFFIVEPWNLNERLILQQASFLFPMRLNVPFETNITKSLGFNTFLLPDPIYLDFSELKEIIEKSKDYMSIPLIKFIIPEKCIINYLMRLANMNITAATLFAGLDGFARSLKFKAEACAAFTWNYFGEQTPLIDKDYS